ncbi:MAG: FAD-dependent oxidoreductase [Bacilli bacterium]|nr:FAD-dependent oxidoreductase [Bacilli bacterium]
MKKISIWEDSIKLDSYNKLNHNIKTDILIIGGGITGISTMYYLEETKYKVTLVEQNKIGMATTSKSTGKLTYMQNDLLYKIKKIHGDKVLLDYINSQKDAIKMTKEIVKKLDIDCNLEKVSSEIFTNKDNEIPKLKEIEEFLINNNIKVSSSKNNIVNSKYIIKANDTYIYNPLKFINGLTKNIKNNIYENTSIIKITKEHDYYKCITNDNKEIKTKYIVLASHYPYFNIPYMFPIKGYIEKSYLSASPYKSKNNISLISYSNPFISIRTYENYLIYLSNSHSTNKSINDNKNYQELIKKINNLKLNPEYLWSNSDIITNDYLPYIGVLKDNIIIGTGYNTWGLTNGFLAGSIIKDIILKKDNKYINLFNPNRININTITKSITNGYKNIDSFIKSYKEKPKIKCPHMGCNLIYNDIENTWDCPCHGSRFNEHGKSISSPANKDIDI